MKRIPAGTYTVGSSSQEREELCRRYDLDMSMLSGEMEGQQVELPEFFIDEYPVTNAQYAAFIAETGAPEPYDWPLHATAQRADHPVVGVGGSDAAAYAAWVGKRLPTPEEYEAAFSGVGQQPDRTGPFSHWVPITYSPGEDPGPVSTFGVHGFGQVSEWSTPLKMKGEFAFRMMKGANWFCRDGWSLRPAVAYYAFAPWCRQWTGLRCASDSDVTSVPTAALPEVGAPTYHTAPSIATDGMKLIYRGGRGMGLAIPGVSESIGIACPEGILVNDKPPQGSDVEDLFSTGAESADTGRVTYRFRAKELEVEVNWLAGEDFIEMNYVVTNPSDTTASVRPSACVNAGLLDPFYDFEGARSWIWLGKGDWMRLRALPRAEEGMRWISYVTLPDPCPEAAIIAVESKDGGKVFGYGRTKLIAPLWVANNYCFTCLHLDPEIPVTPGGRIESPARIYCLEGDRHTLRDRFVADYALA